MRNDHDIITKEEIIELTGYHIPSKQCEALKNAGIFFIIRRDGRPQTTWGHFQDPLSLRHTPKAATEISVEPNFGALD